ncbi:trypsin-like serine peptidase [Kitasatospora sp. NPDC057015]|uniref:trypsin-like serine peptidase n=1 Tax=Kitasatospora sp. NPDC057015 TaxID=3346001 RepID=UPI003644C566
MTIREPAAIAVALVLACAGCAAPGRSVPEASRSGSGPSATAGTPAPGGGARPSLPAAPHGWTRDRIRAAVAEHPGTTRTAAPTVLNSLVGAVFTHSAGGDHFCTASVVDSAGLNLIVTAAHCVYDPHLGQRDDLVFVPGYRGGDTPNGVWPLLSVTVDQAWKDSGDPDVDVAFAVVAPQGGQQVQQVLGANLLGIDRGFRLPVKVTGYPSSGELPITCSNTTTEQSPTQLRVDCPDYTGGTSGSPWVTDFDPGTMTGTVVGVIGGYQEGGDTADTSYSSYFGERVQDLYDRATG